MITVKLDPSGNSARYNTTLVELVPELSNFYKIDVILIEEREEVIVCILNSRHQSSFVYQEIGNHLFAIRVRDVVIVAVRLDVLLNLFITHLVVIVEVLIELIVHR